MLILKHNVDLDLPPMCADPNPSSYTNEHEAKAKGEKVHWLPPNPRVFNHNLSSIQESSEEPITIASTKLTVDSNYSTIDPTKFLVDFSADKFFKTTSTKIGL